MADGEDEPRARRRLAVLLLVAIVVILGAGIGTFTLIGDDPASTDSTDIEQLQSPAEDTVDDSDRTSDDTVDGTPVDLRTEASDGSDGTPDDETDEGDQAEDDDTETDEDEARGGGGSDDGGSGTNPPDDEISVSLEADGEGTLLEAHRVVPGDAGTETITLRNAGNRSGTVQLARTEITDLENGIVDPEAPVDDSPDRGELSEAVKVRMIFEYPDGTNPVVVGSESSYVTLASLNNSERPDISLEPERNLTVRLEWRVDENAGNEIQSDGTVFDAVFQLRAPET